MKIRKAPHLSAKKLIKVQPMTTPSDILFHLDYVWSVSGGGYVWSVSGGGIWRKQKYYYWEMFREKK